MRSLIGWAAILAFILVMAGCGPVSRPASAQLTPAASYIVLRTITIDSNITAAEEGIAVLIRVTNDSATHPAGAVTRYPENGVVLVFDTEHTQALSPALQISNDDDTNVEVMIVAVPRGITAEALEALNFAFTEVASNIVPGGRLGLALKYAINRTSDRVKGALQEGRLIGYRTFKATELAREPGVVATGITVTSDLIPAESMADTSATSSPAVAPVSALPDKQDITVLEAYDRAFSDHNIDQIVSFFHNTVEVISTDNSVMRTQAELRAGFADTINRKQDFKVVVGRDYTIENNLIRRIVELSWREGKTLVKRTMQQEVLIESGKIRRLHNTLIEQVRANT